MTFHMGQTFLPGMHVRPAACPDSYLLIRGWAVPQMEPLELFSSGEAAITTEPLCKMNQCAADRTSGNFLHNHTAPPSQNAKTDAVVILSSPILYLPQPSSQDLSPRATDHILAAQHLALPLPHLSTYLDAAHSWHTPQLAQNRLQNCFLYQKWKIGEDQQVLMLFSRSGEPNSVEFTGQCKVSSAWRVRWCIWAIMMFSFACWMW